MKPYLTFLVCFVSGCQAVPHITFGKGKDAVSVDGPKDAGKPATINKGDVKTSFDVPAETKLVTTKVDAVPATSTTPYIPAKTVTEWSFSKPTHFEEVASTLAASTGTVDTSIRQHQIDSASRAPLLYGALACGAAAVFFVWRAYPTPALLAGAGSLLCLVAWKVTDLPSWMWGVAVLAAGLAYGLYHGHERGLANAQSTKS